MNQKQNEHQEPQIRSGPREEYHHLDSSLLTPSHRWSSQKKTFKEKQARQEGFLNSAEFRLKGLSSNHSQVHLIPSQISFLKLSSYNYMYILQIIIIQHTWATRTPERALAQARLVRLDERISRSGDPSSPRRDFAQQSENSETNRWTLAGIELQRKNGTYRGKRELRDEAPEGSVESDLPESGHRMQGIW
ncbi:hypothetical protein DEO72_LG11g1725 [Vigna unguiculata]|uniref:Uncharacterized protein n=1 Tax=Vigna unguiculata TaxID=3917 RepID=A0A4D6NLN6_VIGUN|nr:hypothetical protein DEO72_LG11g1725 [Vigna unguiculata]